MPLAPETRQVFDKETSGHLYIKGHENDKAHREYSQATEEFMDQFMKENNIKPEEMTPDQARSMLKWIEQSQDPRIRNNSYNVCCCVISFAPAAGVETNKEKDNDGRSHG